ncbi:MAG: nitroreductase family protein [bacterium]|nr:nitroreductase family protein [bacterium]MDE0287035.1 nitroreductase family protein [bacterium]MDE0440465.1 nitroreductase family protein [bacterium]
MAPAVFEAMRRRRMHRVFAGDLPSRDILEKLVYAAGRAQVARPGIRHLIVVTDPRLVRTVRQACPGFVNNAPAIIVICSDLEKAHDVMGPRGVEVVTRLDAGAAAAFVTIAAPALGIGVCKVTSWTEEVVQAIFGLPDYIRPEVLMAVGIPVADHPKPVKGFHPTVHHDRYGRDWNDVR